MLQRSNLSIFQKLLIAPGVTLAFLMLFFVYVYLQHKEAQDQLETIKLHLEPTLLLANKELSGCGTGTGSGMARKYTYVAS